MHRTTNEIHTLCKEQFGFCTENQRLPRSKPKTIFLESGRIVSQKTSFFFLFWFPLGKKVFRSKTVLVIGNSWFFGTKPFFPWKNFAFAASKTSFSLGQTKVRFLEFGRIVSRKIFFGFPLGKVGLWLTKYSVSVRCMLTSNVNEVLGGWPVTGKVQCCR